MMRLPFSLSRPSPLVLRPDPPRLADIPEASEVHVRGDFGASCQIPVPPADCWVLPQVRVLGSSSPWRTDSNHLSAIGGR